MANENENLVLTGLFQMVIALVPLFKHAGRPDVAEELLTITGRADTNYDDVIRVADARTGRD